MPEPLEISDLNLPGSDPSGDDSGANDDGGFSSDAFLEKVDAEDRLVIEKYLPDWQAGVTQHQQSLAAKYKPYEDLGADIDTIANALQIWQYADTDPVGFYEYIKETLTEMGELGDDDGSGGQEPPGGNLPEFEGVPEQFVTQFKEMQTALESVSGFIEQQKAAQEQQSNQQQLDTLMEKLHTDHGDFDDAAILGRMAQGMEAEAAVKDYQGYLKKISNPRPTPPPTLQTGGTPGDPVDREKLKDRGFRKNFVAERLAAAAES